MFMNFSPLELFDFSFWPSSKKENLNFEKSNFKFGAQNLPFFILVYFTDRYFVF